MKSVSLTLAAAALLVFAGTTQAQDKGAVAVVDIDAVANELGISEAVVAKLQAASQNLNQQLANAKGQLQGRMNQAEAQVGQQANDQARQQLVNFNRQLNEQYDQLQAQARQAITNTRNQEIRDFQEKLKPIALDVAKKKGFQVVMMKISPPVFAFTEEVDITADVTAAAKAAGIKVDPAPAAAPAAAPATPPAAAPAEDSKGKGDDKGKAKAKADDKG